MTSSFSVTKQNGISNIEKKTSTAIVTVATSLPLRKILVEELTFFVNMSAFYSSSEVKASYCCSHNRKGYKNEV